MRALTLVFIAACGGAAPVAPVAPVAPAPTPAPKPALTAAPTNGFELELEHGHPTTQMFDDLVAQFPTMSAQRRSAIAALGTSQARPIHVPAINYEYVWVEHIACNGGAGKVGEQALIANLDELSFTCPNDPSEHAAYFDFSDDPQEQQMRKELGGN